MIPEETDIPTLYDFNHSPLVFFKDIYINLGHIYFYDRRHPILKGKKQQLLKQLSQFYSKQYVQKSVIQLLSNARGIQEIKRQPEKYFRLQLVFDYHLTIVYGTRQSQFKLSKAIFKINDTIPMLNLREKAFWHINFFHLITLDLHNSLILNIQGLSYCNLPVLKTLKLQKNIIMSISILSKCNFTNLEQILFEKNRLTQLNKISRLRCPKLTSIIMDTDRYLGIFGNNQNRQTKQWYTQRIDFILKMQNLKQLKKFPLDFQQRMQPRWHQKIMKKAVISCNFYTKAQQQRRKRVEEQRQRIEREAEQRRERRQQHRENRRLIRQIQQIRNQTQRLRQQLNRRDQQIQVLNRQRQERRVRVEQMRVTRRQSRANNNIKQATKRQRDRKK